MPPFSEIWNGPWVPPGGVSLFSQFSGYGGAIQAAKQAKVPLGPVYTSEVDYWPSIVEAIRHPEAKQLGDITRIRPEQFSVRPDVIFAGWPCTDNSRAGCQQLGPAGARSGLIRPSLALNNQLQAPYVVYENTPMQPQHLDWYNRAIGVNPVSVNANTRSPISRERLFWPVGFNISPMEGQGPPAASWLQPHHYSGPLNEEQMRYLMQNGQRQYNKHTAKLWNPNNPYLYTATHQGSKGNPHNTFQFEPGGPIYFVTSEGLEAAHGLPEGHTKVQGQPPWRKGQIWTPEGARKNMIGNGFDMNVASHIWNDIGNDMRAKWEAQNGPWEAQKHQWSQRNGMWVKDQPVEIAAPSPQSAEQVVQKIQGVLSPDLLHKDFKSPPEGAHPTTGHCYAASEAAYFALGGKEAGWKPMNVKHEGVSHWFIQNINTGQVVDPTAEQFKTPVPYEKAIGKGFSTTKNGAADQPPSSRARAIMDRAGLVFPTEPSTAPRGLGPGRTGQRGYTPASTPLAITGAMGNAAAMAASAYYDAIQHGATHEQAMTVAKQAGGMGLGFAGLSAIVPKVAGPLAGGLIGAGAAQDAVRTVTGKEPTSNWVPTVGGMLGLASMFNPYTRAATMGYGAYTLAKPLVKATLPAPPTVAPEGTKIRRPGQNNQSATAPQKKRVPNTRLSPSEEERIRQYVQSLPQYTPPEIPKRSGWFAR